MKQSQNKVMKDFLKTLFMPLLVNKAIMLYFGINYSRYPDEGYGYGLLATILILFITLGTFFWRYRNIDDP